MAVWEAVKDWIPAAGLVAGIYVSCLIYAWWTKDID